MEDYFSNEYEASMVGSIINHTEIKIAYSKLTNTLRCLNDDINNGCDKQKVETHIEKTILDFNNYILNIKRSRRLE